MLAAKVWHILVKLFICSLIAFGAVAMHCQTPVTLPVSGNLGAIIGSPVPYAGVLIELQNCTSPVSIAGYSVIVQTGYQIQSNGSGVVNSAVWPNDLIDCNGTTGNSQYLVSFIVNGAVAGVPQCYQVTSTQGIWNLNTQQPITCGQSPPNPMDVTYRNLTVTGFFQGNNGDFTGNLMVDGTFTLGTAPGSCPTNKFVNIISATLAIHCDFPTPTVGVAYSNGDTGWAASLPLQGGDPNVLSSGVITATIGLPLCVDGSGGASTVDCMIAGSFYQTVLNGSHTSDAVVQRLYLAVGPGTGIIPTDVIGIGSQVSRTVLNLETPGTSKDLVASYSIDPGASLAPACFDGNKNLEACTSTVVSKWTHLGTTSCNFAGPGTGDTCTDTLTFPTAFADTSYGVTCFGKNPTSGGSDSVIQLSLASINSTTQITVTSEALSTGSNLHFADMYCLGVHN